MKSAMAPLVALLCLFSVSELATASAIAARTESKTGDKTITKVVKLLQNMLDKSKDEGEEERVIYAKFKCYCDHSEAEKKESIAAASKAISILESSIEELQGSNGELSSKAADLKARMADNKAKRDEATSVREKQHKEFKAAKSDFEQAIGQMRSAIETLSAVGADQTMGSGADHKQFMAKASMLQTSVQNALSAAEAFMDQKQYQAATSFLQAPFTGTYTSQSGQVMGIIKNMRDTFIANLKTAIADEEKQVEEYDAFMEESTSAYKTMKGLYEEAQAELGANDAELSSKRSQLNEAQKSKSDDEEFLDKLLPMCEAKAKSYDERKVLRANEEVAIAEAISILNSDAAFDTFGKAQATSIGATSFMQTVQKHFPGVSDEDVRQVMQRLLRRAAGGRSAPRLTRVISTLQANNPFDTVLEEIDKMLEVIEDEQVNDKKKLGWCMAERKATNAELKDKNADILKLEGEIDELEKTIHDPVTGLLKQIDETENSLRENHESQVTETEERQEKNKAYQKDVKNLVTAQEILENAIKVLKAYYDNFDKAFLQSEEDPAPPSTWGEYKGQSSKGNDAITMLQFIQKETNAEEKGAHASEEKAQAEYEDSMQSLKDEQAKTEKILGELQDKLAQKEQDLVDAEEDYKATLKDAHELENYLDKIKPGCDFITKNFGLRSKSRETETKALQKAKGLLKDSPAYKEAEAQAKVESFGECKKPCTKDEADVTCKACMAEVTIPGYCAGHPGTKGC